MKVLIFTLLSVISASAYGTTDALTSAWIVTQNIQDGDDFSVVNVPVIGCYGVNQGPQLMQFTAEYAVTDSIGCGFESKTKMNLNALSCAKTVDKEENADYASFRRITLDLTNCPSKNNKKFITMVRTAAARNFPQTKNGQLDKTREVELTLLGIN